MIFSLPPSVRLALLISTSSVLISASTPSPPAESCYDHEFTTFNATSSVTFPPLLPAITIPNSSNTTWTLSTAIREVLYPNDKRAIVKQKYWLESSASPPSPSPNPAPSPFDGCMIYLAANPNTTFLDNSTPPTTTPNSTSSCSRILSPKCQDTLLTWIRGNVSLFSPEQLSNQWTTCPKIAHLSWDPPASCQTDATEEQQTKEQQTQEQQPQVAQVSGERKFNFESISLQPFNNPSFIAPSENGCNATDGFDVLKGSAVRNGFLELSSPETDWSTKGENRWKTYDQVVSTTNPVLFVGWPRNRTGSWKGDIDARVVCLSAGDGVEKGSRVPPRVGAGKVSGGGESQGNGTKGGDDGKKQSAAARSTEDGSRLAFWILVLVGVLTI